MRVIDEEHQRIVFGALLAGLWLSGLFLVLDAESLLAKAFILLALAPLSLQLDRLVSRFVCRHLYQPVAARALRPRRDMYGRRQGEISSARSACVDERLAA